MSEYQNKLALARFNPGLMQDIALTELEAQLNGTGSYDVPNAAMPFVFALECSTLNTAMYCSEGEALLRKLYPSMALSVEELYPHMSDDDYIGRFATPAFTTFELYISKNEVLTKAVPVGNTGMRKLLIPRFTNFKVAGQTYTMQFPIELRVMAHGGISIVYDAEVSSPIQVLETNLVDWKEVNFGGEKLLLLRIPVGQFAIATETETLSPAVPFDDTYTFTDQFYHARVYIRGASGVWKEIATTHSDQVYDPLVLTAVLKVTNNKLYVRIPVVYMTQGMAQGEIRVDIYTTRGEIDIDLGSYDDTQYTMDMVTVDDDTTYVSPLNTFNRRQVLNPNRVTGGSNAVAFDTLRASVLDGTLGASRAPITNVQLSSDLSKRGYSMVTNIDNITNRQFLASRRLSAPDNGATISGAGCVMGLLQVSMDEISASKHVMDNGPRMTVLPSMLYAYRNGKINVVTDAQINQLLGGTAELKARAVVETRFLYTPLHYVFDTTLNSFDMRPYYLDQPSIQRKTFVGENDTAQLQVSIAASSITRIAKGWRVTVVLQSSDAFKEIDDDLVHLQLGYRPVGENAYATTVGVYDGLNGLERQFHFDIESAYDIDAEGHLYTTNMSMYDEQQHDYSCNLQHEFDLSICVTDSITPGYVGGELDALVQAHLLPQEFMVVQRERLDIVLGYDMSNLWRRNRTVLSEESYETWPANVQYFYEETIYKRDANGQIIITKNPDNTYSYAILHAKGAPVLGADGKPVFRYLKGDVKLDANQRPVLKAPRKLLREVTMLMVDGIYYFATEESSVDYRETVPMELVGWLQNDVALINKLLLEQSHLYLYPTATYGDTVATIKEGLTATIPIDQSFWVDYYMTETAFKNASIREGILASTKALVSDTLGRSTISVSDIVSRLRASAGDDVIGIEAGGLGGAENYPLLTIKDAAVRLGLRKKLTVLANQTLLVEDDIRINFKNHNAMQ
jgi:hypothetical protein